MSQELLGAVKSFKAQTAIPKFRAVKIESVAEEVSINTSATTYCPGITTMSASAGQAVPVCLYGTCRAMIGGIYARGTKLKAGTSGKLFKTTTSDDEVVAVQLDASTAANNICEVLITTQIYANA